MNRIATTLFLILPALAGCQGAPQGNQPAPQTVVTVTATPIPETRPTADRAAVLKDCHKKVRSTYDTGEIINEVANRTIFDGVSGYNLYTKGNVDDGWVYIFMCRTAINEDGSLRTPMSTKWEGGLADDPKPLARARAYDQQIIE